MRVRRFYDRVNEAVDAILKALSNGLTAADNFGPEGEKGQVLMSNGPRDTDPPPSFQDITTLITSQPGLKGPKGDTGGIGPPGEDGLPAVLLRGVSWSNKGQPVDLNGQRTGVTPGTKVPGEITNCTIVGQGVGSAVFGVKACLESAYPVGLTDITGGSDAVITLASIVDVPLAGWTTAAPADTVFEFFLKSVTGFTQVEVVLEITPT
jgi:hypothetical protein